MLAFEGHFDHINATFQRFEAGLTLPISTFMLLNQYLSIPVKRIFSYPNLYSALYSRVQSPSVLGEGYFGATISRLQRP